MGKLTRKWVQDAATDARSQSARPAVDDEHVFVGGLGEELFALSRADGSVSWSVTRDGALSDSSPCYRDGCVYVGSGGGSVYALDASDGSEIWKFASGSAVVSSPIVRDGTVYVGRDDGTVLALDAADGSLSWRVDVGAPVYTDLDYSTGAELVYAGTKGGSLFALDAATGASVWSQRFGTAIGSSAPVVDEARGLVYFAADEIMALTVDAGAAAWATNFYGANAGSAPVFDERFVYAGGASGRVYALAPDGSVIYTEPDWTFETRGTVAADPAVFGGRLAVAALDGTIYLLDSTSGSELDRLELDSETRSSPVVVDGEVYIGSRNGDVYAFEVMK